MGSLHMCFNIPKLKELKNERFITVDKPGILLLFRLALKSLWSGTGTPHTYWKDFLVPQCSWESEESHWILKQRNTPVWGHSEALERKLLSPGVCTSHSFSLIRSGRSCRIACEVCRGSIIVACLINLICLIMVLGKYVLSVGSLRVLMVF